MTWPWPGDTRTDRAQRCARWYREALHEHAPAVCRDIDSRLIAEFGQQWLAPTLSTRQLDDYVTVDEAAEHVGLQPSAVYKWIDKDRLDPVRGNDNRIRVRLGDALEVMAENRRKRSARNPSSPRDSPGA